MAIESVPITAGHGTPVAVDTIDGNNYQVLKIAHGPDGTATLVEEATPFPVSVIPAPTNPRYTEDEPAAANPIGSVPLLVRRDVPTSEVDMNGDNVAARGTTYGAAYVTILNVDGSLFTVPVETQYTEDVPAAAFPVGNVPMLVRSDTPAGQVSLDGDNVAQRGSNYGAAYVTLLDTNGAPLAVGGGTQYTEDAAAPANPIGTAVALVRADTPAATVTTDGDVLTQRGTNFGAAYVTLLDAAGAPVAVGGGTQYTEDAAAAANPIGTVPMLIRSDTPAIQVTTDGDNVAQRGTNYGASYVTLLDTSGTPVSVGGGTQYAEDTAHSSGDQVTMAGVVQQAADTALSSDGDRSLLQVDASGHLKVNVKTSALPAGSATAAKQDTEIASLASIDGKITAVNTGAVVVASGSVTANAGTNLNTSALALEAGGNLAAAATSLAILDDWDEADRAKVNTIAGQVGVQGGSGAVSALTQRVVLATDVALPAGNNNIGDVDAIQSGTWTVQPGNTPNTAPWLMSIHDGTTKASVRDLTNGNPIDVAIVDGNGDQISSFGGGTQYTEDAAAAANPVGTVPILVRADTPASVTTTDGDNVAQRGTDFGAAYVTLLDAAGSPVAVGGGTQYTEDAAAAANPIGTVPMLVRSDTPAAQVTTDGDNIAQRGTNYGASYVTLLDTAGAPVAVGGGTQYTEDGAIPADTGIGTLMVGRRDDALSSLTPAEGDAVGLRVDGTGALWVNPGTVTVNSHAVTNAGTFATQVTSIAAGDNNIGNVDVVSLPALVAGTANIGDVDVLTLPALPTGDNNIGNVDVLTLPAIPAGTNNIGDVDVLTLPALPAGTNNIGDVDVLSVPADPFGANADAASATGSISAKLRFIAGTGIPVTGTVTVGSHAVTNAGTFATQPGPTTSGGCTPYSAISTAAVLTAELKGAAGQLYGLQCFSISASPIYVRVYNQTGAPASTDGANIIWRGIVPGNAEGRGFVVPFEGPIACSAGIGIRASAGVADNDTAALSANVAFFNAQIK